VDKLFYQELSDLVAAIKKKSNVEQFDTSCFDGEYITGDVDDNYLYYIDALRNDAMKQSQEKGNAVIELHNNA
jgi:amidophosphoribosyltransferase